MDELVVLHRAVLSLRGGGGEGLPAQPQHLDITGIHVDTQPCFYYRVAGQRYSGIQ